MVLLIFFAYSFSLAAFGATTAAPSLFGAPANTFGQQPQQPQATGFGAGTSLFGAPKPAAPSLFGAPAAAGGGLFSQPPAQQPTLFSSGLGGGLGNSFNNSFAAPNNAQQQQNPTNYAVASAEDVNAYGSNPLFSVMATSPANRLVEKKKPPMWRLPDHANRSATKITRLRGFGQSSQSNSNNSNLNLSRSSTPLGFGSSMGSSNGGFPGTPLSNNNYNNNGGRDSPLRLINGIGEDAALSPNAFVSRSSVKKLVIDRKSIDQHLASSGSPSTSSDAPPRSSKDLNSNSKGKVSFNPDLNFNSSSRNGSQNSNNNNNHNNNNHNNNNHNNSINNNHDDSEFVQATPSKKSSGGSNSNLGESDADISNNNNSSSSDWPSRRSNNSIPKPLKHGDYFSVPSIESLQKLPSASLRSLPDLIVGRVGYGQVAFQQPVDLTTLQSVQDLLGNIIIFEDRNCTVYPSDYDEVKPSPGQGLNVEATITLERCYPIDKATRLPIKESNHPRLLQHIKRLRNLEDTHFIDFDAESGKWTFSVVGF